MKLIIFRSRADRQEYADLQLIRIFGDQNPLDRINSQARDAMWRAIALTLLMFALWCFVTPARAGVDCLGEASRFEMVAKMRDAGAPRADLEEALAGSLIVSREYGVHILLSAPSVKPEYLWYWAHGMCNALFSDRLIAGARIRKERRK